jgi:hypothetical protein
MFTIIKNCSPYYVLFTYDGLSDYINVLQDIVNKSEFVVSNNKSVTAIQEVFPSYRTEEAYIKNEEYLKLIIDDNPCTKLLDLDRSAVFLTTYPKVKSPIHIDMNGATNTPVQFRINYPVFVKDDKCITSWYNSENITPHAKIPYMEDMLSKVEPIESLHFSQDYAILFNTTMYHDWDNTQSENNRTILGLRADKNHFDTTFDDAKKMLFGI